VDAARSSTFSLQQTCVLRVWLLNIVESLFVQDKNVALGITTHIALQRRNMGAEMASITGRKDHSDPLGLSMTKG
jgi:hypothetical protein